MDLEVINPRVSRQFAAFTMPEGLPRGVPPQKAATLGFAAKEAAFKAMFPLTGDWLEFADIRIEWKRISPSPVSAQAQIRGRHRVPVRGEIIGEWVVMVAIVGYGQAAGNRRIAVRKPNGSKRLRLR